MTMDFDADALIKAARNAANQAYAPYSGFHVGAALLYDDNQVITGSNFENASYGLSLCAETVAIVGANQIGRRGGLIAAAVIGGTAEGKTGLNIGPNPVTPCGRCRQMLNEVAQLGQTDPVILSVHAAGYTQHRLSQLLPVAFGPANLD